MAIEVQGMESVMQSLEQLPDDIQRATAAGLTEAGENLVEKAKATKTYTDRTGRLTASIGGGVSQNGKVIVSFGFGSGEGAEYGQNTLEQSAAQTNTGATLHIVAGMPYATYVERKGYAVLDGVRLDPSVVTESIKQHLRQ